MLARKQVSTSDTRKRHKIVTVCVRKTKRNEKKENKRRSEGQFHKGIMNKVIVFVLVSLPSNLPSVFGPSSFASSSLGPKSPMKPGCETGPSPG